MCVKIFLIKSKSEVAGKIKEFKIMYENYEVSLEVFTLQQWNGIREQDCGQHMPTDRHRTPELCFYTALNIMEWWSTWTGLSWRRPAVWGNTKAFWQNVGGSWTIAVYRIYRSIKTVSFDITPSKLSFTIKPQMDHLSLFESKGYAHLDNAKRKKLMTKRFKCMFLGYAYNVKE